MANSSTKVSEFLKARGRPVITATPNDTAEAAIQKLVSNNIGALPVCDTKGAIVGIVSERDLLKECSQRPRNIGSTRVSDVMTKEVVIALLDDSLDYALSIMTQKAIRHLPIMDGPKLQGMISIRDVVDTRLEEATSQVRFLSDYIDGGYR